VCYTTPSFFLLVLYVEANLQVIKQAASARKEENNRFKDFLKQIPTLQVDGLVVELNEEVSSKIDCTICGNCCKILEPPINQQEIDRLADIKSLNTQEFESRYVGKEPSTSIKFLKCQPCIFLQKSCCSIYEMRPASCADYPHLTQPNFKYRWKSVMANYSLCPIVFNVVEKLKEEVKFTVST
jgi:uncharacterized protein